MPEGFQIVLRQPTWTDGDVRLLLEDTAQGLFTCVSKSGKPSLMGNNVASFAAVLQPWQASLLEQAITSANFSPLQVNYHLKYLAKLPPVRIRIYAAASDFYAMYKQYGTEINGGGVCADPDTVIRSVSQHVISRDVVRITIDSGGLTIDDKTFTSLQEMALGMLQDWIKQEFVKPPPERATKEQIENIQLRQLTEADFRSLDIRIEQSATVEMAIYPQGTMGKLIAEGEDLSEYMIEVDLSTDEFYQNREVGIKVYADFPVPGAPPLSTDILFVEVTAYYGDGPGRSMTWDASGGGASLANGGRGQVFLSEKGGLRQTWSVPLLNPAKRSFKYLWTRRNQEGGIFTSQDVPGAPADGRFQSEDNARVETGDPNANEDMLRVVVDPLVTVLGMPDGGMSSVPWYTWRISMVRGSSTSMITSLTRVIRPGFGNSTSGT
ncbi:MAG: hypothetical protein ACRERE_08515 [Candidatus Entotheonellia bacterium]